jgi:hypothetical protein
MAAGRWSVNSIAGPTPKVTAPVIALIPGKQEPCARRQEHAAPAVREREPWEHEKDEGSNDQRSLEGDDRRNRKALAAPWAAARPPVMPRTATPSATSPSAAPFPTPERKAKDAIGEDGEGDETGCERSLDDRQRRERESRDMEPPGNRRHPKPERPPLLPKERDGRRPGVAELDLGSRARAAVTPQEPEVRDGRRNAGEHGADQDAHRDAPNLYPAWSVAHASPR